MSLIIQIEWFVYIFYSQTLKITGIVYTQGET